MQEKYSSGFYSEVFKVDKQQKLYFPQSDLVKVDESSDKNWFARLFYRHKIASLLFPDNFINVTGSQVEPWERELIDEIKIGGTTFKNRVTRVHRLFSQMAHVPENHAVFSQHITVVGPDSIGNERNDRTQEKVSLHDCVHCKAHREFHKSNDLQEKAINSASPMLDIGILPPIHDPSDYCLTEEGNIIFFEIDNFDEEVLGKHLSSLKNPNEMEENALRLLRRINELFEDSRLTALGSGIAGELRIN